MRRLILRATWGWFGVVAAWGLAGAGPSIGPGADEDRSMVATRRALGFLRTEVPSWSRGNGCFSCHNNGDGARALLGDESTPTEALGETLRWLTRPEGWAKAGAESPSRDDRLARLQFTLALAAATARGRVGDRTPLAQAAAALAADQAADGSWPIDEASPVGSPATYGRTLATALARRALAGVDPARYAPDLARADAWLGGRPPTNVAGAAAWLIAGGVDPAQLPKAVALLRQAQNDDGGWGPYPRTPTEAFDTALALLALHEVDPGEPAVAEAIRRGRQSLAASQNDDGSWPATTRPAGGLSYAQQVSTTAWAALALQSTHPTANPPPAAPRR